MFPRHQDSFTDWVHLGGDQGKSVIVFESEDAARGAAEQIRPPREEVTLDSVEVGEVVAHA